MMTTQDETTQDEIRAAPMMITQTETTLDETIQAEMRAAPMMTTQTETTLDETSPTITILTGVGGVEAENPPTTEEHERRTGARSVMEQVSPAPLTRSGDAPSEWPFTDV